MATRAREIADRMEAEQTGKAWDENLLSRALKRAVSTPRTEEEMNELTREVARGERAPQRMAKGGSTDKEGAKYKATLNYPYGGSKPRMEILRDNVAMRKPTFEMSDAGDEKTRKEAEEYASELQRETRGLKKGGSVKKYAKGGSASSRADGCAMRGKTKGRYL